MQRLLAPSTSEIETTFSSVGNDETIVTDLNTMTVVAESRLTEQCVVDSCSIDRNHVDSAGTRSSDRSKCKHSAFNYVALWISLMGPPVGLTIPITFVNSYPRPIFQ